MTRLMFLLALMANLVPGMAKGETVEELAAKCVDHPQPMTTRDAVNSAYCAGYMSGTADGVILLGETSSVRAIWCLPEGVTYGQMKKIFVKWTDNHPEALQWNARAGVALALHDAFPCPTQ
jgi:Rap1a immunity proteins